MKIKKIVSIALVVVMVFSLSATAFAATEDSITVNGTIQNTNTTDPNTPGTSTDAYDVTFTTTVYWWVTQANPTAVVDGTSTGPGAVNNIIKNESSSDLKVSFVDFVVVSASQADVTAAVSNGLTLFLTGNLTAGIGGVGSQDLASGYTPSAAIPYESVAGTPIKLLPGTANQWTYGFTGTYSGSLSTTALTPQYTMTLEFDWA